VASYDYSKILATAQNLVAKFGQDAIIRRKGAGDFAVSVVMVEYHQAEKVGKLVQYNDRKAVMSAAGLGFLPINPETDQLVLSGQKPMQIVSVFQVAPGGVDIIFELQVRR
jgi:hypothetical protein